MSWFWIIVLTITSAGLGTFIGMTMHAWALRKAGYELLHNIACVQCRKPIPSVLYHNTLSGGHTYCSDQCVIESQKQLKAYTEAYKGLQEAIVLEIGAFKVEQQAAAALIKVQIDLISNYALSEKLLQKEIKMYQDALQGMSTGAQA